RRVPGTQVGGASGKGEGSAAGAARRYPAIERANVFESRRNRKVFTVEALKATDFKDKPASLMEDVTITIFGNTGARHDTIHTKSCQYERDAWSIVCSGKVELNLQSAEDAARAEQDKGKTAQIVHVEPHGVTFHHAPGRGQST